MNVYLYQSWTEKELKNAYIWWYLFESYWYYTFDDQNSNQITDFSWNNRNLTWWTMPSYTLVSGTNYAWNYTNQSSWIAQSASYSTLGDVYTMLLWVKPTATNSCYVNCLFWWTTWNGHQLSVIWWYNSGEFEYYEDKTWKGTVRTAMLSGISINTRHLIWYTRNWTAIQTYWDWVSKNSVTGHDISLSLDLFLWSSDWWDRFKWQIWECIIEDKVWTTQEISNYYNRTKSSYWIS